MFKGLWIAALFSLLLAPGTARAQSALPEDRSAAVILAYQRVGEESWADGNLAAESFAAHLEEIKDGCCAVMPLPEILDALEKGRDLPPRALALTFEGAYRSAYDNAMSLLLQNNIPFTVFIGAGQAGSGEAQYLDWAALRRLKDTGLVSFGIQSPGPEGARGDVLLALNGARARFREEMGEEPRLVSYPSGDYTAAYKDLLKEQGIRAAFGLQSGAAYAGADLLALPRFTMTESYGDVERFRLVTAALPLPAQGMEPPDPHVTADTPSIGFSVPGGLAPSLASLSCFVSGQPAPDVEILGESRVELRPAQPVSDPRTRVNCTMPGPADEDGQPRWRWLGMILVRD